MTGRRQDGSSGRKLLRVLLAFDTARPTWTVADLAAQVGVPLSSAYRYVSLLREEGLIESVPGSEALYRLGPRATAVGRAAVDTDSDLVNAARPHLQALRDASDESAFLLRPAGDSVVCIDRAESRHPVRLQVELGQTMPTYVGTGGRVLLAYQPDERRATYLSEVLPQITDAQLRASLSEGMLEKVREHGWTESQHEFDEGVWGCAAAISDDSGVVAAIGTAGPLYRFDEPARWAAIAAVRSAADAVSAALTQPSERTTTP